MEWVCLPKNGNVFSDNDWIILDYEWLDKKKAFFMANQSHPVISCHLMANQFFNAMMNTFRSAQQKSGYVRMIRMLTGVTKECNEKAIPIGSMYGIYIYTHYMLTLGLY